MPVTKEEGESEAKWVGFKSVESVPTVCHWETIFGSNPGRTDGHTANQWFQSMIFSERNYNLQKSSEIYIFVRLFSSSPIFNFCSSLVFFSTKYFSCDVVNKFCPVAIYRRPPLLKAIRYLPDDHSVTPKCCHQLKRDLCVVNWQKFQQKNTTTLKMVSYLNTWCKLNKSRKKYWGGAFFSFTNKWENNNFHSKKEEDTPTNPLFTHSIRAEVSYNILGHALKNLYNTNICIFYKEIIIIRCFCTFTFIMP